MLADFISFAIERPNWVPIGIVATVSVGLLLVVLIYGRGDSN
jgi:hypothetical protein